MNKNTIIAKQFIKVAKFVLSSKDLYKLFIKDIIDDQIYISYKMICCGTLQTLINNSMEAQKQFDNAMNYLLKFRWVFSKGLTSTPYLNKFQVANGLTLQPFITIRINYQSLIRHGVQLDDIIDIFNDGGIEVSEDMKNIINNKIISLDKNKQNI